MSSKIALDLKQFKHVKSDDKSVTLRHKDGHELTIATKAMSPDAQKQLAALAPISKQDATQLQSDQMKQEPKQNYAQGGQTSPIQSLSKLAPLLLAANGGDVEKPAVDANLSDDDKSAVADYTTNGVNYQGQKDAAQILAIPEQAKNDPTLQNMLQGTAMGSINGVGGAAKEIAEDAGNAGWQAVASKMKGSSPNASSATPEAIAAQNAIVNQLMSNPESKHVDVVKAMKMLNKMKGYADGGDVTAKPTGDTRKPPVTDPKEIEKDVPSSLSTGWTNIKNAFTGESKAQGGEVQKFADGTTDVQPSSQFTPDAIANLPAIQTEQPQEEAPQVDAATARKREIYNDLATTGAGPRSNFKPPVEGPWTFDGNTIPAQVDPDIARKAQQKYDTEQALHAMQSASAQQDAIKQNAAADIMGTPHVNVPNVPQEPQMPGSELNPAAPTPGEPPAPPPDAIANSAQDAQGLMQKGYQNQMTGIKGQADAQGALGMQQAEILHNREVAQQQAQTAYKQHYDELEQERQAHMQDIKDGFIDPNKYWTGDKDGNGGHSKVAAGIGMILAGFNPTSNPNAAVNFLKFQMEQNLKSQGENLGAQQNLLTANLRQFGNLRDATDMTRLMQSDIMQNELQQAAAKAQTPLAKNAALQAAGQLQMQYAPLQQQFAMRRAMMGLAQNGGDPSAVDHMLGYMRVTNPEMAKEMESRYVPGIGMGSVPIPDAARGQIVATKNVNDLFNRSLAFAKQPIPKNPADYAKFKAQADTVQQQLIGSIKQAQHDGVYKESEAEFLIKQIGDSPASVFRAFSSVPKVKELQQIKQQEYGNLLNQYGIKGQALPQAAQSPQIKTVNGIKYMRGANGQAIQVK